jgi:hypothetical protein
MLVYVFWSKFDLKHFKFQMTFDVVNSRSMDICICQAAKALVPISIQQQHIGPSNTPLLLRIIKLTFHGQNKEDPWHISVPDVAQKGVGEERKTRESRQALSEGKAQVLRHHRWPSKHHQANHHIQM